MRLEPLDGFHELPLFTEYPELLTSPPRWQRDKYGRFVLCWTGDRHGHEIQIVLMMVSPTLPTWTYAIYDQPTNTIRHYVGSACDPTNDTLVKIEQAIKENN